MVSAFIDITNTKIEIEIVGAEMCVIGLEFQAQIARRQKEPAAQNFRDKCFLLLQTIANRAIQL